MKLPTITFFTENLKLPSIELNKKQATITLLALSAISGSAAIFSTTLLVAAPTVVTALTILSGTLCLISILASLTLREVNEPSLNKDATPSKNTKTVSDPISQLKNQELSFSEFIEQPQEKLLQFIADGYRNTLLNIFYTQPYEKMIAQKKHWALLKVTEKSITSLLDEQAKCLNLTDFFQMHKSIEAFKKLSKENQLEYKKEFLEIHNIKSIILPDLLSFKENPKLLFKQLNWLEKESNDMQSLFKTTYQITRSKDAWKSLIPIMGLSVVSQKFSDLSLEMNSLETQKANNLKGNRTTEEKTLLDRTLTQKYETLLGKVESLIQEILRPDT